MMKKNISTLICKAGRKLHKHSPEILTSFGIAGMLATVVLAVKATPKALSVIEDKKKEEDIDELSVKETVRATWTFYVPAAVTCGVSLACLICANSEHMKRNAALIAAYTLSESSRETYKKKVIETIGENKEKEIRQSIAEDEIKKAAAKSPDVVMIGSDDVWCYDEWSGRAFKSDMERIKKAINELNKNMIRDTFITLNEFYSEIGLDPNENGEYFGWDIGKGLIEMDFDSRLTNDGKPCLAIKFINKPLCLI